MPDTNYFTDLLSVECSTDRKGKLTEEWRRVPGWAGLYEVSNLGRVRSMPRRHVTKQNPKGRTYGGRVLKLQRVSGYPAVRLVSGDHGVTAYVHEMVLGAFVGFRPEGHVCRHLDGDKENNHVDNLAWGTPAENAADTVAHGRSLRGRKNPNAVLRPEDIPKIRGRLRRGEGRRRIAADYGVTPATITNIKTGHTWGHIPNDQ